MDAREIGIAINGSATAATALISALIGAGEIKDQETIVSSVDVLTRELFAQRVALMKEHAPTATTRSSSSSSSGGGKSSWGKSSSSPGSGWTKSRESTAAVGGPTDKQLKYLGRLFREIPHGHLPDEVRERFSDGDKLNYKEAETLSVSAASELINNLVELQKSL